MSHKMMLCHFWTQMLLPRFEIKDRCKNKFDENIFQINWKEHCVILILGKTISWKKFCRSPKLLLLVSLWHIQCFEVIQEVILHLPGMFFFRKETTIFDVEFHLVNLFKIKWLFKVRFYFIYRSGNRHVCSILARRFKKKTNCFWKLRWTYILWYKSQFSIQTCSPQVEEA